MQCTWKFIACPRNDLQLLPMLTGGQSFRWKNKEDDKYLGVFRNKVWELHQVDSGINFRCQPESAEDEDILKQYLRLETDLKPLYKFWSKDEHFRKSAKKFYAVRMLDQSVTENVFSFICSSNNNISRISSMVEKLCKLYGDKILTLDGVDYYGFPKVSALVNPHTESTLRSAGFGYRSKYIYTTACKINDVGEDNWVKHLKSLSYEEAKEELRSLSGIGAKVADCICLMSLNHLGAIPVDTHVFQIARTYYLKHLKDTKSLTDKVYNEIGDHFRDIFGPLAGWAHTVLFCNELKSSKAKKRRTSS